MDKIADDKTIEYLVSKLIDKLTQPATGTSAGLMSAEDKDRLDKLWNRYGNVIGDIPDKDKELP